MPNLRACAVQISYPGGGASGFMVLPDMILTCFHVVEHWLHVDPEYMWAFLGAVEIHTQSHGHEAVRRLWLGPDNGRSQRASVPGFSPWLLRPGDPGLWDAATAPGKHFRDCGTGDLDFAFVRLLPLREPTKLFATLPRQLRDPGEHAGRAVVMRHFPMGQGLNPHISMRDFQGNIQQYRQVTGRADAGTTGGRTIEVNAMRFLYAPVGAAPGNQTNIGSSGAMLIEGGGPDNPAFVIGMHTAVSAGEGLCIATPLRKIIDVLQAPDTINLWSALTEPNPLRAWKGAWAQRLSIELSESALKLIDRDPHAVKIATVPPPPATNPPVWVLVGDENAEVHALVSRLLKFELPITFQGQWNGNAARAEMASSLRSMVANAGNLLEVPLWNRVDLREFPKDLVDFDEVLIGEVIEDVLGGIREALPLLTPTVFIVPVDLTHGFPEAHHYFLTALVNGLQKLCIQMHWPPPGWYRVLVLADMGPATKGSVSQSASANRNALQNVPGCDIVPVRALNFSDTLTWCANVAQAFSVPNHVVAHQVNVLFGEGQTVSMRQATKELRPVVVGWATSAVLAGLQPMQQNPQGDAG